MPRVTCTFTDDEAEVVNQVVSLTEAQMAEAQITVSEGQVLDASTVDMVTHMTVSEVEDDGSISQVEISDGQFITTHAADGQLVVSQEDVDLVQTEEIRPDDENMIAMA